MPSVVFCLYQAEGAFSASIHLLTLLFYFFCVFLSFLSRLRFRSFFRFELVLNTHSSQRPLFDLEPKSITSCSDLPFLISISNESFCLFVLFTRTLTISPYDDLPTRCVASTRINTPLSLFPLPSSSSSSI